jgi:hypothetical protein
MKFAVSKQTINILKNFATINTSIIINPGKTISTLSVNKNIFAKCEVNEKFDKQIAIYDLPQLLGGLSLFEQPEFDTTNTEKLVVIDAVSKAKSHFYYADPSVITSPPDKDLVLPSKDISFLLTKQMLRNILNAARVYQVTDLCINGNGEEINILVTDKKNSTSNVYSYPLGETEEVFCHCFKVENLRIIPDYDYEVVISEAATAAQFSVVSDPTNLRYWIALEPNED